MFLQSMREKTQSWVAYVIVALLILSFALWGISSYFGGGQEKGPVATVGGEKISYAIFASAYRNFVQNTQPQSSHYTSEQEEYAKQVVLKSLIQRFAIIQYISKAGFAVNQEQIDAALMAVPLFSENGEFSPALFKRFLMVNNISAQQFITDFSARMTMAQWDEGIRISSFSTPLEMSNIISLLKQKREIVYGMIKSNSKNIPAISAKDVTDYYQHHKNNYVTPEKIKISYIKLSLSDLANKMNPSEKELITFYTQNSSRYDSPESWQVNVIKVHSASPVNEISAQVTAALSKKSGLSTLPGAELTQKAVWLSASNLSPEIKSSLHNLKPNGVTSGFETGKNTYIVYQLLKQEAAVTRQYYEVKDKVKAAYISEQANQKWAQALEQITDLSYEHPDSLNPIAKKFDVSIQSSDFFSQNYDGKTGIASNAEVITAAFSDDVLVGGNNSDVIKLNQGKTIIVLRVADRVPAHEQTLAEVKDSINKTLIQQRAMQYAKRKAESLQHALESDQSIEKIQKQYGVILTKQSIGRFSQSVPNEILQQAFISPLHQVRVAKMNDSGFFVVEVLSVTPGTISSVPAKDQSMYKNVIVNEWAQAELLSYVNSIMADTKVKTDNQVVANNS